MRPVVAAPSAAEHAEGPLWDARSGRLLYVDMIAGDVLELVKDADPIRHHVGTVAAAIRSRASGGFIVALENGFAFADDDLAIVETLPAVFDDPEIRMNDGGCDPQGRMYCGTMAYDMRTGGGKLYRLDTDRHLTIALEGVTISNGLQWSADGSRVFYNDTPTGRVDVFDFDGDTGAFSARRTFATMPGDAGMPDGMAIDSEGGIWIALWGGGGVRRYDEDGTLTEVIDLPVRDVTACTFGGADLSTLYITTSRMGLGDAAETDAGAVFAVDVPVTGAPAHPYRG